MVDFHTKSFFGLNTAIIVTSPAKTIPYIFIRCIKRNEDQTWEKSAKGEGKTVKISIEEIICILEVLRRNNANWRGYHIFKDDQTEIYVGWMDNDSRQILLIKIGGYEKKTALSKHDLFIAAIRAYFTRKNRIRNFWHL